jgi:hypothetical protein
MERLGDEQLRVVESSGSAQKTCDADIEVMMAKIRLHGPIRKRDLFRRFKVQQYGKLEPVLARCCERELVRVDGEMLYPVLPGR